MTPTLEHLATLIAVLDAGTLDGAAVRLHVTASAVSQRIKAMERSAGQILLKRTNPAQATAAGESLVRYARQVDLLATELREELRSDGSGWPSIAVAVNADSLATWFLPALAEASSRLEAVFDVHRDDQDHTVALLRSGTVTAAVSGTERAVQGCTSHPLGSMRYRAVASPGFVERYGADLARLDELPTVDFDRKDELQRDFVRAAIGREPSGPRHLIPTSEDFARAVRLGLGWGMLPEQQITDARSDPLVELAPDRPVDVPLYWQRWNIASPFLDTVTDVIRTTAARHLRPPR